MSSESSAPPPTVTPPSPARVPAIGVGVVVLKDRQVLLIRRGKPPYTGQWSLPGGRQEWGETVAETARREVREETGIEITALRHLAVVDGIMRDETGAISHHYTLVDFAADWLGGEPVAGDDALDARWHDLDALDGLGLWGETLRVIRIAAS